MKKKPINPLTSFYSNMSVNGFSISLFFLYNFKLGSSNSSSAESIVTRSSWRRRRASLFISSHSFHRCRQTLFLLFCFVSFYLFFSTLFTTERCVSSVHEDVSVITKTFLAEEARVQEMRLSITVIAIVESKIMKFSRSGR